MVDADLESIVAAALEQAKAAGVDQAEVVVSRNAGLSVTARLGDVENIEYTNDRGLAVTVYRDQRKGSASTSELTPAAIGEAIQKACAFANHTAADEYAGLADVERMATEIVAIPLDFAWDIDADTAIAMAVECERAALDVDPRIRNSEGATVASGRGMRAYGNTHGFIGSYAKSSHSLSCLVLAEADGDMHRDYYYSSARDPNDLEAAAHVGRRAGEKTIARLGARKIATTKAPVLFVPELARGFIGHAIGAISGGAQYRKASFLLNALGEQLFPAFLSIQERPHLPKAMASAPFDAEGVLTYDRDIVTDGYLQSYVLSSYSARRLGMTTTANAGGTHNLIIPGADQSQADLMRQMGRGLIVRELIGQGVNGVTGDYSRGAVGHWVENGDIAYPVQEITIAGNLRDLYQHIGAVGNDIDTRGGIRCGSVLVEEMTIAGS